MMGGHAGVMPGAFPGMMYPGQPMAQMAPGMAMPGIATTSMFGAIPGILPGQAPSSTGVPQEVANMARTQLETQWSQARYAHRKGLFEPQDFKPADDDPLRFYWVREVDGNWTQRNRLTIDNLGDCRWYLAEAGYFYAIRLNN